MSRRKIATRLQEFLDEPSTARQVVMLDQRTPEYRAELRALLAVARAARRDIVQVKAYWGDNWRWARQSCKAWQELDRALARLDKVSGGGR